MSTKQITIKTLTLIVVTLLLSTGLVFAQGQSGNGDVSGGGGGNQSQDRDQVRDPVANEGNEPIQDRDRDQLQDGSGDNCVNPEDCDGVPDQDSLQTQDRDRLQDATGDSSSDQTRNQDRDRLNDSGFYVGDTLIQDRDQLRDMLRNQLEDPSQDRDRDRIRANDPIGLEEIILTTEALSDSMSNGLDTQSRALARSRNVVDVGVMSLVAAQNMIGWEGPQVAGIAQEIHSAHRTMVEEEQQIEERSFLSRLLFGGDSKVAASIQDKLQQNNERMQQIKAYLKDCECDEEVKVMLQEQVQAMEGEHVRLGLLVEEEVSLWGLLSWRF